MSNHVFISYARADASDFEPAYKEVTEHFATTWESSAGVQTFGNTIANLIEQVWEEGAKLEMTKEIAGIKRGK